MAFAQVGRQAQRRLSRLGRQELGRELTIAAELHLVGAGSLDGGGCGSRKAISTVGAVPGPVVGTIVEIRASGTPAFAMTCAHAAAIAVPSARRSAGTRAAMVTERSRGRSFSAFATPSAHASAAPVSFAVAGSAVVVCS